MYKEGGGGKDVIKLGLFYLAPVFLASVLQHLKMKHIHLAFRMNGFNKGSELGKGKQDEEGEGKKDADGLRDPSSLPLRPFPQ